MKPASEQPPSSASMAHGRSVTLMGMSGVGKTRLSRLLQAQKWFHYSVDYRIGTHYLNDLILDEIKRDMMQVEKLKSLLRNDSIYVKQNLTVDNLEPLSAYIGKFGAPEKGGLDKATFLTRQEQYAQAERNAMRDIPAFIARAREIYGYPHFLHDSSGSLCEVVNLEDEDDALLETISAHSVILYMEAGPALEAEIIKRQLKAPKPMYYNRNLFLSFLEEYKKQEGVSETNIVPDDFIRAFFPKVMDFRRKKYRQIAQKYGHIVQADQLATVENEADFIALLDTFKANTDEKKIARAGESTNAD